MTASNGSAGTAIASWDDTAKLWQPSGGQTLSLFGPSEPFSGTWPTSGSMRSGCCFRRPPWVPRTGVSGSSFSPLLPSPDAGVFNDGQSVEAYLARKERELAKGYNSNGGGTPLAMAVRLLPTPRVTDANGPGQHGDGGPDLRTTIAMLLPTPQARDGDSASGSMSVKTAHRRHHEQGKRNLDDAIALLPTPAARDHKGVSARKPRTLADGTVSADPCRNNQLPNAVKLLPPPRASDGEKGGPNQRGSSGDLMLPSAVMLLPTPTVNDSRGGRNATSGRSNPDSQHHTGETLTDVFWEPPTGPDTGRPSSAKDEPTLF